jgi:hypothetical protein
MFFSRRSSFITNNGRDSMWVTSAHMAKQNFLKRERIRRTVIRFVISKSYVYRTVVTKFSWTLPGKPSIFWNPVPFIGNARFRGKNFWNPVPIIGNARFCGKNFWNTVPFIGKCKVSWKEFLKSSPLYREMQGFVERISEIQSPL